MPKQRTPLEQAAYVLAMQGLQSDRYASDAEYKEAVDKVLLLVWPDLCRPSVAAAARRTLASDIAEDR